MRSIKFIALLLILSVAKSFSQQANHWFFGNHASLDFSSGTPVAVSGGALITQEGCAAISDATGNLLFYTDGVSVFNKLNQLMPNGTGLLGHSSSTQSSLIVQKPGSASNFYVFTTDAGEYIDPPNNGLHFSEVDMTLDGGNGDVIAATKNTLLLSTASEKLCGTAHANGTDIWVMAHGWGDSTFYAYLVTGSGVNASSVNSQTGTAHTGNFDNNLGQMKFSPQGDKIALAVNIDGFFELFDFDNASGIVSNPLHLYNVQFISAYGVEFSPDGSRLYGNTLYFQTLYQYNLNAGSPVDIMNSLTTVGAITATAAGGMQLGPDGKIYMALNSGINGSAFIARINFPNVLGTGCNYVNSAVSLGTGKSFYGLPDFISTFFLTVGINENNFLSHFNMYYDYRDKSLKINFDELNYENYYLRVIDISGKEILNSIILKEIPVIYLPQLETGIYVFECYNSEINFSKKIFIYF
ncbi:MAG: hypothetical protein ACHQNT_03660 [Bacteroidia bacterium]